MNKEPQNTRWIERILSTICDPDRVESILGDLDELYEQRLDKRGKWSADLAYLLDALGFMRPFAWKKIRFTFTNPMDMLKNYFKLSYRNFIRQKVTSFINVLGFTIGIVSCLLIALYIQDELRFDSFHENKDRIYRMTMDIKQPEFSPWE